MATECRSTSRPVLGSIAYRSTTRMNETLNADLRTLILRRDPFAGLPRVACCTTSLPSKRLSRSEVRPLEANRPSRLYCLHPPCPMPRFRIKVRIPVASSWDSPEDLVPGLSTTESGDRDRASPGATECDPVYSQIPAAITDTAKPSKSTNMRLPKNFTPKKNGPAPYRLEPAPHSSNPYEYTEKAGIFNSGI